MRHKPLIFTDPLLIAPAVGQAFGPADYEAIRKGRKHAAAIG
jgi:hypothetical protein